MHIKSFFCFSLENTRTSTRHVDFFIPEINGRFMHTTQLLLLNGSPVPVHQSRDCELRFMTNESVVYFLWYEFNIPPMCFSREIRSMKD